MKKRRLSRQVMIKGRCASEHLPFPCVLIYFVVRLKSTKQYSNNNIDLILNYNVKTVSEGDARYDNKGVF